MAIKINLPEDAPRLKELNSGDEVLITGTIYTLRDAGHARCMEALEKDGMLPFDLEGQTIFYAGPSPASAGRPFGAIGPTTSSRMDFAAPDMYKAGIVATIGKGKRSDEVRDACRKYGCVYLVTVGGIAALLAKCTTSEEIIAWDDLGTEALRKIEVCDLPAYVGIDTKGCDLYLMVENS